MESVNVKSLFAIVLLVFGYRDLIAASLTYDDIKLALSKTSDPVGVDRYLNNNSDKISLATYLEFLYKEANEGEQSSQSVYNSFMDYIIASGALPKYRSDIFEKAMRYAKKESTLWEKTKHIAYSTTAGVAAGALGGALLGPTGEFIKDPQYQLQSSRHLGRFLKGTAPESALRFGVAGAGLGGVYGLYRGVTTRNNIEYQLPSYSRPISERIGLVRRRKGTQ